MCEQLNTVKSRVDKNTEAQPSLRKFLFFACSVTVRLVSQIAFSELEWEVAKRRGNDPAIISRETLERDSQSMKGKQPDNYYSPNIWTDRNMPRTSNWSLFEIASSADVSSCYFF